MAHHEIRRIRLFIVLIIFAALPAFAADWPSWRGPNQTGVSSEKNLISNWSTEGENLIWKSDFVGRSTPVVMNGRVYVIGRTGVDAKGGGPLMQEHVACFDAGTGKLVWEHKFHVYHSTVPYNRVGWASLVGDPETGNIYAHGVGGMLIGYNKDGKILWSHPLTEDFGHVSGYGGRTDTPVVDGDLVIQGFVSVEWGDYAPPRHRYYAFDKNDGKVVWVSTPGGAVYDFNVYSTPVVAVVNGQRLLIGGNADGSIYAMKVRTGEKVWGFQLSKRGINSSVVVDGTRVFASHSEENLDEATMGRVVAIDGTGKGDITKTGELWRYDRLEVGYTSPAVDNGKLYVIDNSANIYTMDATSGKLLWKHNIGTVGKGSPVIADGKIYVTEVNGHFTIIQLGETAPKELDKDQVKIGERHAEIYGSPAIAYGRIYFTTEGGVYCLGDKSKKMTVTPPQPVKLDEPAADPNAAPAAVQIVPAEVLISSTDSVQFKIRTFDAKGAFLKETNGTWTTAPLKVQIDPSGKMTPDASAGNQAGTISAKVGELEAKARIRIIAPLPLKQDFETFAVDSSPVYWIGAGGKKFLVKDLSGNKVLAKPPAAVGIQGGDIYIGPSTMKDYVITADVMGTKDKRRVPDIGLINCGYTLDLMGNHQRLQIRSWASELRIVKNVEFKWQPDTWYTMKMQIDYSGNKAEIKGKVWPKADPEPEQWSIVVEDPIPITKGSPGLYGNSTTVLYFDNVQVTPKSTK
jgi:outer membrane protein assembly factor BamB